MSYGSTEISAYSTSDVAAIAASGTSLDDFLPSARRATSKPTAKPTPQIPPPASGDYLTHEVKLTDTLAGLALKYGTKVRLPEWRFKWSSSHDKYLFVYTRRKILKE